MPLYDYSCPQGHRLEVLVGSSRPDTLPCEHCGQEAQREVPDRVNARFRGLGLSSKGFDHIPVNDTGEVLENLGINRDKARDFTNRVREEQQKWTG